MLHLILIAQLNILPDNLPSLPPVSLDSHQHLDDYRQQQRKRQLEQQQRQMDLIQKRYQMEKQELYESLPPSRIDCFPLFPPVSGYPPGSSAISCHRP